MAWQDNAKAIFGNEWIGPLAAVACVPKRKAQRWDKDDTCPTAIQEWLYETRRMIPPGDLRRYAEIMAALVPLIPDRPEPHEGIGDGFDHFERIMSFVMRDFKMQRLP